MLPADPGAENSMWRVTFEPRNGIPQSGQERARPPVLHDPNPAKNYCEVSAQVLGAS